MPPVHTCKHFHCLWLCFQLEINNIQPAAVSDGDDLSSCPREKASVPPLEQIAQLITGDTSLLNYILKAVVQVYGLSMEVNVLNETRQPGASTGSTCKRTCSRVRE